jgi:CHAT domain-containing protein
VTIVLPTQLAGLPLGALLQEAPPRSGDGYDLAKAHWLIRDFSFALVNSARELLATTSYLRRPPAPRPYLGIGAPKLAKPQVAQAAQAAPNGTLGRGAAVPIRLADLEELPESADELNEVGALLAAPAADILTGAGATEQAFLAKPPGDYDVIHFATHGLITEEVTGLSEPALVLTPSGSGDASRDGLLLASEIFDLSLNARLIVLSACNTARYDVALASLAAQDLHTAFTVAGVPTLLVSLWPLDSTTARDLVVRFFKEWRSPQADGAADALARATRAFLDSADGPHQHPRFWAPFVVAGNGGVRSGPAQADRSSATGPH